MVLIALRMANVDVKLKGPDWIICTCYSQTAGNPWDVFYSSDFPSLQTHLCLRDIIGLNQAHT